MAFENFSQFRKTIIIALISFCIMLFTYKFEELRVKLLDKPLIKFFLAKWAVALSVLTPGDDALTVIKVSHIAREHSDSLPLLKHLHANHALFARSEHFSIVGAFV